MKLISPSKGFLTNSSGDNRRDQLLYEFFENFESEHTKKAYWTDIVDFLNFCQEHLHIRQYQMIERFHVISFKNWLTNLDRAPKTINRKLAANSSFFAFLVEKNICHFNPFDCIRRPKQVCRNHTQDLQDENVEKLLAVCQQMQGASAPLHSAIIYLLFFTGIRKNELIELKRKDFYLEDNGHYWIQIKAKGGKYLQKIVPQVCADQILNYLDWCRQNQQQRQEQDWLFQPTRNPLNGNLNKPLNPKSVDYILSRACQKAGLSTKISPHSARATYIGSALDGGMDLYKLAQDVGHSSVKTTEDYNKRRRRVKDSAVFHLGYGQRKKTA